MGLSTEGKTHQKLVLQKTIKNAVFFKFGVFLDLRTRVASRKDTAPVAIQSAVQMATTRADHGSAPVARGCWLTRCQDEFVRVPWS